MYTEKKEAQNFSAFPCAAFGPTGEDIHQRGMSMRDWFAGMALQGICANEVWVDGECKSDAEFCYKMADAMMEARVQNGNFS